MATITQGPLATGTSDAPEATPEETEKKKAQPRDYSIGVTVKGTADKLKAAIDKHVADGRGEVFIKIGTQSSLQPKLAMAAYAKANQVDGTYDTVATGAFKSFGPLKSTTVTKNTVEGL
jgi:hypothetical protein